ncbi:MAG: CvpA family protein [Oscillochloridaceae bacterium umkhey_bin13]
MNTLDVALLMMAGLFMLLGLYWGLIRQVLSVVGLVVGVVVAGRLSPEVAVWLSSFVADPQVAGAVAFLGVLFLVSTAASLVASVLRMFVGLLFLGWLDHLLGAVLGLIQAVLGGAIMLIAMVTFPLPLWSEAVATSTLAAPLLQVATPISGLLPDLFGLAVQAALMSR